MEQEKIIKMQYLEQEAQALNQQLELIDQNISEMQALSLSLAEIENKENNEFLVNIGKKIYFAVEIKKEMPIMEVGNKTFVRKSIPDAKKIIEGQENKLAIAKTQIIERLNALQEEANILIQEMQEKEENHNHEHHEHHH
jgi:prefoldin alpha subunit